MKMTKILRLTLVGMIVLSILTACSNFNNNNNNNNNNILQTSSSTENVSNTYDEPSTEIKTETATPDDQRVNVYGDMFTDVSAIIVPYVDMNNNIPYFTTEEIDIAKNSDFENYAELDELGRCGIAFANLCIDTMPTEERGNIGHIKPSGWNQEKYPGIVNSNPAYLYNRCHLIGFQLAGENANKENLITGTRYFNLNMLPFENQIADYIKETNNHVLYRVTPIYYKENLVANGVILEALSLEDNGKGICFNVFVFNVQPGICIDYATGENHAYDNYQEILNIAKEAGFLE